MIDDVKKGENIDLYITVLLAIILTVLHLLHFIPVEKLGTLTLVVLTILAYTILGNRHRLEEILENVATKISGSDFLSEFPPSFSEKLKNSKETMIVGTHISSLLTSYHQVFGDKIKAGHSLKVLLMLPDGQASKMATMRFPGKINPDTENVRIKSSIETLNELKAIAPDLLEIRTIDFLFDYTAYFFDSNIIFVERHTFKISGGPNKPKAVYERGDGKWFHHLESEIKLMWETSKALS